MERWNWPFKTPEERVLVAKYFAKTMKQEKRDKVNNLGEAPF